MIITINNKTYGSHNIIIDERVYLFYELDKHKINIEYSKSKDNYYAYTILNKKKIRIHRLITQCPKGLVVDHINGDTLDNRMCNLRICTQKENCNNRLDSLYLNPKSNNKLGVRGLSIIYDNIDKRYYYRFKLKGYKTKCFALSRKEEAIEYAKAPKKKLESKK